MFKAASVMEDGRTFVFLGLSKINLEKLQEGKPIPIDLSVFGVPAEVLISYGETEEAIMAELRAAGIQFPG